jgi:serine protease
MKRWILLFFCLGALGWATAQFSGNFSQGTFESIIIDFREEVGDSQIQQALSEASQSFDLVPRLNSEFSEDDHLFIVPGNGALLQKLKKSGLDRYTESLEPNYIYSIPEASQIRLPIGTDKLPELAKADIKKKDSGTEPVAKKIPGPQQPTPYPNDPLFPRQWNLQQIHIEEAWKISKGKGTVVAVIGTGISRVSDLEKTDFVAGYDFINDNSDATDDQGHGTHIAGTIAQSTNNGFGAAGIAPEASLMPVKVLSIGGNGTVADISEGIRFAADRDASVIALSMVGNGNSLLLQKAIEYAHRKGSIVIAPAGNSGNTAAGYPARYRYVIGVSALNSKGEKALYSNAGAGVDISAPGGWIQGEDPTGGILQNTFDRKMKVSIFAPYQGTSMAVPHVAGVAALLHTLGITDPDEVGTILMRSAHSPAHDPRNDLGAGKLDASNALKLAQQPKRPDQNWFDWARDRGYIDARFWLDEQEIAAPSKLIMAAIALVLAWSLGQLWATKSFWFGLLMGSCGLFLLRGIYLMDASQIPFRILGSTLSEVGSLFESDDALNPVTASGLIPLIVGLISLRYRALNDTATGLSLGMAAALSVYAVTDSSLHWMDDTGVMNGVMNGPVVAKAFLAVNAGFCWGWARYLALPWDRFVRGLVEPWQAKTWQSLFQLKVRSPKKPKSPRSATRSQLNRPTSKPNKFKKPKKPTR